MIEEIPKSWKVIQLGATKEMTLRIAPDDRRRLLRVAWPCLLGLGLSLFLYWMASDWAYANAKYAVFVGFYLMLALPVSLAVGTAVARLGSRSNWSLLVVPLTALLVIGVFAELHDRQIREWEEESRTALYSLKALATPDTTFSPIAEPAVKTIGALTGARSGISSVALSPDGQTAAASVRDNKVILWDIPSGKQLQVLTNHTRPVLSVAFSPDGRLLASGGADNTVQLWDLSSKRLVRTLTGHTDHIVSVAISLDGRVLASAGIDRTIRLWDTGSYAERCAPLTHPSSVFQVAFSPDGAVAASAGLDGRVRVWNVTTCSETNSFNPGSAVHSVSFSPYGGTLASAEYSRRVITIRLWDMATGAQKLALESDTKGSFPRIAFSPDGNLLAMADGSRTPRVWALPQGVPISATALYENAVHSVAFSADGRLMATGTEMGGAVVLWEVSDQ